MKIAAFSDNGQVRIAKIVGAQAEVLDCKVGGLGVVDALAQGLAQAKVVETRPSDSLQLLAPVPNPPRVFGIGLNYRDHAVETGREPPAIQTWFMKQSTAVNAPFGTVDKPAVSDMLDFEVELVVVIGKRARHVPADRAHEIIAGYCVGCDYSVRDWQKATPTMIMGKGFDTHAPFGPYLTTPDEIADLDSLRLRCLVNGDMMQNGCVGDLIFKVPQMIAHLSTAMTLLPGDIIYTGTPAGVGVARTPPRFVFDGDVVTCEIDTLGAISHTIVNEVQVTRID